MKITKIFGNFIALAFSVLFLSACSAPPMYHKTQGNITNVKENIGNSYSSMEQQAAKVPSVQVKDALFVDSTPIHLKTQPAWLKNTISFHGDKLPFSFYSRNIVRSSGVLTKYQTGLDPSVTVNMSYSGDVKGALDLLAAKTGYVYSVNDNVVKWEAFVTKTFDIAFMPGSSNYLVGKEDSTDSGDTTSGTSTSASAASGTVVVGGTSGTSSNQYSNLQASLSIWDDIEKTVNSMLSNEGKAVVSESTTTVTVRDHPSNVKTIEQYIHTLNASLSRQVMVKIQVLDVTLNSSFSRGIDWNVMKTAFSGTKWSLVGDLSAPVALTPIAGVSALPQFGIQADNGSEVFIKALSQQGKVAVTTEPTMVTTNNQVASINITRQTGYLATFSTQISQTGDTSTTSIQPGQVNAGLTLFVLPKIMGNKVYLQVSSSISQLESIQNLFTSGNQDDPSNESQKIQAPILNEKDFNQRSVITSGSTLILAGYKQMTNEANNSAVFQVDQLGGKGAIQQNVQTIVLITPYILDHS